MGNRDPEPAGLRDEALAWLGIAGWCAGCEEPLLLERRRYQSARGLVCERCQPSPETETDHAPA